MRSETVPRGGTALRTPTCIPRLREFRLRLETPIGRAVALACCIRRAALPNPGSDLRRVSIDRMPHHGYRLSIQARGYTSGLHDTITPRRASHTSTVRANTVRANFRVLGTFWP